MKTRIAAIADTHYANKDLALCTKRRSAIADILLLKAVHRLNRYIKPDVTLLLGDLLDEGSGPAAASETQRISEILDILESPVMAIPGNHDADIDSFHRVLPRPQDTVEIGGVRFLPFIDPEEPGYNARRTRRDLQRMKSARADGWDGPLISVQHVPLFPAGASACPYHFINTEDALAAMRAAGFTLSISGHYHAGDDLISRGAGNAVMVPALCEFPFAFVEIEVDGDSVHTRRHILAVPPELGLIDYHVHTPFAYCQENMDLGLALALSQELGLAGMAFAEHTGHLYFDKHTYFKGICFPEGIRCTSGAADRMGEYLRQVRSFCPPAQLGLEIDCDFSGDPVVRPGDREQAEIRIGAVHRLAELRKPQPDPARAAQELLSLLDRFLDSGIQVLAHPFRVFRRAGLPIPEGTIPRVVEMLGRRGVAAEINFHTNEPPAELVRICTESGVKLVFGSDAHNLYEVGEFAPHLDLLGACGLATSSLPHILADFQVRELQRKTT